MDPYEARATLLERAAALESEDVAPEEALGRWLAHPITAPEPRPAYSNSAMDGFAVRTADTAAAQEGDPVRLQVVGEARVDEPYNPLLGPGEAVRINTGGPVPDGADAVVPVERTTAAGPAEGGGLPETVTVYQAPAPGAHIRPRGEELMPDDEVLPAGLRMNAAAVALLSTLGVAAAPVHRRPRVAAVVTGDEFARGARDANGPLLRALGNRRELEPLGVEYAGDQAEELAEVLHRLGHEADVVLSTGGASVGPHDSVGRAWERVGVRTLFWKVAVKPGKPVRGGVGPPESDMASTLFLALPGNPQSVLAGFEFFAEPLLRRLAGGQGDGAIHLRLPLADDLPGNSRTRLLRGRVVDRDRETAVEIPAVQGSGMLLQAARYPLVAEVEGSPEPLPAGTPVPVRAGVEGLVGRVWTPDPGDSTDAQEDPTDPEEISTNPEEASTEPWENPNEPKTEWE